MSVVISFVSLLLPLGVVNRPYLIRVSFRIRATVVQHGIRYAQPQRNSSATMAIMKCLNVTFEANETNAAKLFNHLPILLEVYVYCWNYLCVYIS